jgi:hypothetical protein
VPDVIDLNVLRPKSVVVELGENKNQIDVSFIPVGITFDVDEIVQKLIPYTPEAIEADNSGKKTREAFDLSIELCVVFCSFKHPDMDKDWFLNETSPQQIEALATIISDTLLASYEDMEGYQKNLKATKEKTS